MTETYLIDICVCTYRRVSIVDTIHSIAAQRISQNFRIRIVIADNDDTPSAKDIVRNECTGLSLNYCYVHAPARNISVARNAALDAATAPLIAFIDDDEIATPTWLAGLLECHATTGATIVFGPVQAVYGDGPAWLRQADLHSIRPAFRRGGAIDTGYTCNVLLDRAAMTEQMRGCRFDPALGRSGGEDTFFFHQLYSLGARCAFTEAALVHENVPPHRGRLRWLLQRSFRSGQTHARVLQLTTNRKSRLVLIATAKFSYCLVAAAVHATSPARWRRMAVRAALHAGVICRIAGLADLKIY
ncbi:MAG: succinoglycan biosynthesis protein ExoM [Acetobacteraceae bacterium]|jgi:succinoglycan biosynthesis protein ExoM|nr:succinoglycan biosynthesis protein ExoM [Acetobacteraceae bacterium]